jgi:hypothetical protein
MKILSINRLFSRAARQGRDCSSQWRQWLLDPLSHPDLDAMSVTELADLPFEPGRFSRE